jgi:hypothetical protein
VVCDSLTQILGNKERKRLEIYEHKVYMKLHNTLLKDNGTPNLEGHKENLLNQISKKLEILSKIMNERKFLVPKDGSKNVSVANAAPVLKSSQIKSINSGEIDCKTGQITTVILLDKFNFKHILENEKQ